MEWWRNPRVLLALAATAAMGVLFGMLLGVLSGGGSEPSTGQAGNTASSSPLDTESGSAPSSESAAPTDLRALDYGYLADVTTADGKRVLDFDRADFFTGEEARKRWEADGKEPLDYYISNVNKRIRERIVSPDVKVFGSQRLAGHPEPTEIDPDTLFALVAGGGAKDMLITLRYNPDSGEVIEIKEVYLP